MTEENLLKYGKIAAGIMTAAWVLFFIIAYIYGNILGNIDAGMIWLRFLIVPMFCVGTITAGLWLVMAFKKRELFEKYPVWLVIWNAVAFVTGLVIISPTLGSRIF